MNRQVKPDQLGIQGDHWTAALFGVLVTITCWMLADWNHDSPTCWWILLFVLVALLCRITAVIYLVAGWALVWPLLTSGIQPFHFQAPPVGPVDIMYSLVVLGFVLCSFGFLDAMAGVWAAQTKSTPSRALRGASWSSPKSGTAVAGLIVGAVLLAVAVLTMVPEDATSRQMIRLTSGGLRTVTLIWLLGFGWIVLQSGTGLIAWIKMDSGRARIFLRSCFCQEFRRDLSRIERNRVRQFENEAGSSEPEGK